MSGSTREQQVVAVVIGRAGSQGLPGKNAIMLADRPMICHGIRDAFEAQCVQRVYCSTDGEEIARCAAEAGATVVMRPAELADDHATVDSAVRHAIETTEDPAEFVVILYGNVPVRPVGLVDRAVEMLRDTGADSVQSYSPVGKHHPFWMTRLDDQGRVTAWQENTIYRRQDLPQVYVPDGGVIAVRRSSLFQVEAGQPHAFLGTDRRGIHNPIGSVVDVDDEIDLRMARAILESRAVSGEVKT